MCKKKKIFGGSSRSHHPSKKGEGTPHRRDSIRVCRMNPMVRSEASAAVRADDGQLASTMVSSGRLGRWQYHYWKMSTQNGG